MFKPLNKNLRTPPLNTYQRVKHIQTLYKRTTYTLTQSWTLLFVIEFYLDWHLSITAPKFSPHLSIDIKGSIYGLHGI